MNEKSTVNEADLFESDGQIMGVERDLRDMMVKYGQLKSASEAKEQKYEKDKKEFLIRLIEVADHFDFLFENIGQKQDLVTQQMKIWINNFKSVRRRIENIFAEEGVGPIKAEGKFVNGLHSIHETEETDDVSNFTILSVVIKGYYLNDQVLRKAAVIVAKNNRED